MEIVIILIAWFALGFIYLINLTASEAFEELSDTAKVILLMIFLPTTLVIYGIDFIQRRFENGKNK